MPYRLYMSVDGACRRNGCNNADAAAAVVIHRKSGRSETWSMPLPDYPVPTNQLAELTAIMMALEKALEKYRNMDQSPFMQVTIKTDSEYSHKCLTQWSNKWVENGWLTSKGKEVKNRHLIERALDLQADIEQNGSVRYTWVPREQNKEADAAVNKELDSMDGNNED
ncbi:hypothetical protein XPA_010722 [Xanthoria parietina]